MESVVLTGPNGAGKTSILEALSMLAPGRGLRRARLSELARRSDGTSAAGWSVAMRVRTPERSIDIRTVWTGEAAGGGRERRQLTIDGLPTKSQAALSETVALIWLTPDMDGLFTEGTGVRRRFLDRLVFGLDPAHAARTNAHDRAVLQRSTLLRQPRPDPVWLAAIEERIAGDAVAIVAARREVAARLSEVCRSRPGPFPAATIATEGPVERWLDDGPALAAEDNVRDALARSRAADAETGGAAVGAHRSDVIVRHAATGRPAPSCSTGEQKMLLIAIVLAGAALQTARRRIVPLLLLDDVPAHLDRRHRQALFDAVAGLDAQAWYAGTDRDVFASLAGDTQFVAIGDATAGGEGTAAVKSDAEGAQFGR
jgi:Recombinational DNA repair ATPase (RecF pathway)